MVIIARSCEGRTVQNAFDYVAACTIANDVNRNAADEKIFQGRGGTGFTPLAPEWSTRRVM